MGCVTQSQNTYVCLGVLAAKKQFLLEHIREDISRRERKTLMSSHAIHISPGILCEALFIQKI